MIEADHSVDVLLHERRPLVASPRGRTWRLTRRGRWVIGVASCSVLVAVVGYLVADQIEQREQFDHSHAALTGTQHRILAVSAQLAGLEHELLVLTDQVGSDTTTFDQATSQLKGAQTALEAAQANLTQQASLITSLQACLGGVEPALNALSVNNQSRALALLESVSSSCTTAADASG